MADYTGATDRALPLTAPMSNPARTDIKHEYSHLLWLMGIEVHEWKRSHLHFLDSQALPPFADPSNTSTSPQPLSYPCLHPGYILVIFILYIGYFSWIPAWHTLSHVHALISQALTHSCHSSVYCFDFSSLLFLFQWLAISHNIKVIVL